MSPDPKAAAEPTLLAPLCGLFAELAPAIDAAELTAVVRALLLANERGDTCLDLRTAGDLDEATGAAVRGAFVEHGLAARPTGAPSSVAAAAPLVLDQDDRLYLRRHFVAEQRVAGRLRRLLELPPPPLGDAGRALLQQLAAQAAARLGPDDQGVDHQIVAIAAAVTNRLCVITGGPGTGKTTTVRNLLAVLRADRPDLQVALVAPTGKAAARMGQALQGGDTDAAMQATTLHRLLGYLPVDDVFRRDASAPLPHQLVIVDEASMVDLELMDALLAALPEDARLILIGDRDQLASVGSGQVLADLCAAARPELGVHAALRDFCREELGMHLTARPDDDPAAGDGGAAGGVPFAGAVVQLRKNYRFDGSQGIGEFAAAAAARRPEDAAATFTRGFADLLLAAPTDLDAVLADWWPRIEQQLEVDDPATALQALGSARILCAQRHGPFGVEAVNASIERELRDRGHRRGRDFYRGQPILVTANDHQSGLYNGDLGVIWPNEEGRLTAWFGDRDGDVDHLRQFLPLRLPPHETAWAMTVHKSQGSEFDEVLLLLPDRDGPLLNCQLVYTGVTRARQRAVVVAEPELLHQALRRELLRQSGLGAALR